MTTPPKVSVIIRTYNRADRIERAVRSALAQDWRDREIIVIDDGSSDGTREVLAAYPEIDYVYQENAGLQAARLAGLRRARGEFVAYLDSDDEWFPDYLSASLELFERFPDIGLVFSNFEKRSFDGTEDPSNFELFPLLRPYLRQDAAGAHYLEPEALRAIYIKHIPAPSSAVILRRDLMRLDWPDGAVPDHCDDWMEALHLIFKHRIAGAFWARSRWIKWCCPDSNSDGDHDFLYRTRNRTKDRQAMLDSFRAEMTPAEVAVMKNDVAEKNFDAGYELARRGEYPEALKSFRTSLHWHPTPRTAVALGKTCLKALLPRRK